MTAGQYKKQCVVLNPLLPMIITDNRKSPEGQQSRLGFSSYTVFLDTST